MGWKTHARLQWNAQKVLLLNSFLAAGIVLNAPLIKYARNQDALQWNASAATLKITNAKNMDAVPNQIAEKSKHATQQPISAFQNLHAGNFPLKATHQRSMMLYLWETALMIINFSGSFWPI